MNYFRLAYTTPDVLEKIKEAEKKGDFNVHLDPIDYGNCLPVDENFPYIPTGALKFRQALIRTFIISPFMWVVNRFIFRTKIYIDNNMATQSNTNKNENIIAQAYKNIIGNILKNRDYIIKNKNEKNSIEDRGGMIITCNHINKLDALVVKWALKKSGVLRGRQLKVMVADFNNQKGRLGEYMRAFGIMPFPSGHRLVRQFDSAVSYYLGRGDCILVFPEQSEWWGYDRPRPLKNGAFYYAVKNNVSVLPLFITCRDARRTVKNTVGVEKRYFDVHILDRIEPIKYESGFHEKIRLMREENSHKWENVCIFRQKNK